MRRTSDVNFSSGSTVERDIEERLSRSERENERLWTDLVFGRWHATKRNYDGGRTIRIQEGATEMRREFLGIWAIAIFSEYDPTEKEEGSYHDYESEEGNLKN